MREPLEAELVGRVREVGDRKEHAPREEGREPRDQAGRRRDEHRGRQDHRRGDERAAAVEPSVAPHERPQRHGQLAPLLDRDAELLGHRLRARGPVRRILGEAAVDERGELARHHHTDRRQRRRGLGHLLREHLGDARALEREAPGEGIERGRAESVEVAARVERRAEHLLGAHELGRARDPVRRGIRERGRDPEVGDEHAVGRALQQDVVGLHVAVHEPLRMRVRERPRHLAQHARALGARERTARAHALRERLAVHERHHIEDEALAILDRVDRDDVRVRELGREPRLAQEPITQPRLRRPLGRQQLDRDRTIEMDLARQVDDPHAPAAEFAVERVPAGERVLELEKEGVGGRAHAPVWWLGLTVSMSATGAVPKD